MRIPPLIVPPPIKPGDTIGVVAPASPPDKPEKIDVALSRLREQGFVVKEGKHLRERTEYLAGSDRDRAADFNAIWADPEVKAVIALRGGYGSCRILPLLDYAAMRARPKLFLGYSDITALHLAILQRAGLVTLHGPNTSEAFLPESLEHCRRALLEPVGKPGTVLFEGGDVTTLAPGRAAGRLVGGNFTTLLRLLGTPFAPDFDDVLLFLEDVSEKAYRVDGLFTQLHLSGAASRIRGLVLGRFDHTDEAERVRITACLEREAERMGVPCVSGAPIGHFPGQIIVPHGVRAELDAEASVLSVV